MKTAKEISSARRRRTTNRQAKYHRLRNRMNTSYGQPVHVSVYLHPLREADGNVNREKIINRFKQFNLYACGEWRDKFAG